MPRRFARGFTIIESMIVIGIVGVLVSILIYGAMRYRASAKTQETRSDRAQEGNHHA